MSAPVSPAHDTYDSRNAPRAAFACDVHTHTIFSKHAYSTIGECVAAARACGLELLGSTDHYSVMISSSDSIRGHQHFINFGVWPRVWDGVHVLRGVEADIVDLDGHLFGWDAKPEVGLTSATPRSDRTLKEDVWRGIDYAIASIHARDFSQGATLAQTTDMYVHALEDPKVLILGHPGRAGVPFDIDTVLTTAKDLGKLVEINEHSFVAGYPKKGRSVCRMIAERCAELGVMISTGSDAHIACDVGRLDAVAALLDEIHFPQELIATRSAKTFLSLLP